MTLINSLKKIFFFANLLAVKESTAHSDCLLPTGDFLDSCTGSDISPYTSLESSCSIGLQNDSRLHNHVFRPSITTKCCLFAKWASVKWGHKSQWNFKPTMVRPWTARCVRKVTGEIINMNVMLPEDLIC